MSKRQILILVVVALIISGLVLMVKLGVHKYGYLIGGAAIGGGVGIIPSLFPKKKEIA